MQLALSFPQILCHSRESGNLMTFPDTDPRFHGDDRFSTYGNSQHLDWKPVTENLNHFVSFVIFVVHYIAFTEVNISQIPQI